MAAIFISYRRQDAGGHAGRLRDHLRQRFGNLVFQDVDDIADGELFEDVLERALAQCRVALIVIGRNWLSCTDAANRRRLDDPDDWVRIETRQLLSRDIRVIPVLVGGAGMPAADALPEDLRALVKRQARELRDAAWDADVRALIQRLEEALPGATSGDGGASADAQERRRPPLALAGGVAALLTAGIAGWFIFRPAAPGAESSQAPAAGPAAETGTAAAPAPQRVEADSTVAAVQGLGLAASRWHMDDFSGMERPADAAETFAFRVTDGAAYLDAADGKSNERMRVKQVAGRSLTFAPQTPGGGASEFLYVFELSADGTRLDNCQSVRAADFANLGPCRWRYQRVTRDAPAAGPKAARAPMNCGKGSLIDAVDPACVAAARAAGLIAAWRARGDGASFRFAVEGSSVQLSSPALKSEPGWQLTLRSIEGGRVTLAWAGFLGNPSRFDVQSWIAYDLADEGRRLANCTEVTQLSAHQESVNCTDLPPFLVRTGTP